MSATLLVHARSLFPRDGFGAEVPVQPDGVWPSLTWLASLGDPADAGLPWRLLTLALVMGGALLTERLARRLGLGPRAALAALALFAVSPLAGEALRDATGLAWLVGTLAWLGILALEPAQPDGPRRAIDGVIQGGLALVCLWITQLALLPVLFLWLLLALGRRRRTRKGMRPLFALLLVLCLIPLLFFQDQLPAIGFGHSFHTGLSPFQDGNDMPGPVFLSALLPSLSIGAQHPLLLPGRVAPAYSHLIGGGVVLVLLLMAAVCTEHRRLAIRFGGLAIILGSFGAVLIALMGPASAVPTAALMPAAVGMAVLLSAFLEPRRRIPAAPGALPILGLALVALALESFLLESSSTTSLLQRAHRADPGLPYPAVRLVERSLARDERPDATPLCDLVRHASPQLLPERLEQRLGLQALHLLERTEGPAAALAWCDEWLELRPDPARPERLPAVRAERLRLLFLLDRREELLDRLSRERGAAGGAEWRWRVAQALMDGLDEKPGTPQDVRELEPVIEELLHDLEQDPATRTVEALLTLAELRARQVRFTDAIRLAEEAQQEDPDSARPLLVLARIYLASGETAGSSELVDRAIRRDPEDPHARFVQGRLLTRFPRTAVEGVERMLEAWTEDPRVPGGLRELAAGLEEAGKALRAVGSLEDLDQLLARAEQKLVWRLPVVRERARLHAARQQWDDAIAAYERAVAEEGDGALAGELADALTRRGYEHLLRGERPAALARFQRVLEVAPEGFPTGGIRAVLAAHAERPPDDRARLEAAQESFRRAQESYAEGDREGAAAQFQQSLEQVPDNPFAYLNLGRIRVEQTRWAEAEDSLRLALSLGRQLEVDVEHGYLLLVRALVHQDKAEEARQVFAEYDAHHPDGAYREQIQVFLEEPD